VPYSTRPATWWEVAKRMASGPPSLKPSTTGVAAPQAAATAVKSSTRSSAVGVELVGSDRPVPSLS
jgi:hypothetical protein